MTLAKARASVGRSNNPTMTFCPFQASLAACQFGAAVAAKNGIERMLAESPVPDNRQ
jgi:hypothetical protein